jgi:hypothetical protein
LKYLAWYTYRVAISNDRLEAITSEGIRFRYKDYERVGKWRLVRIRAFGFLAGRCRDERLASCRELLSAAKPQEMGEVATSAPEPNEPSRCPHCREGVLVLVEDCSRPRVPELVGRTYQPGGLAAENVGWNTP